MTTTQVIEQYQQFVIANYKRYPVCLARGQGSEIWDADGHRYLDFFPGWGCGLLGHSPPQVVAAVREQVGLLIHGFFRRPDKLDVATAAHFVEVRVFGQETITGVNGLHIANLRGADHAVDLAIAVRAFGRTDAIGLRGKLQVGGAPVGLAENGNGLDAQLSASANDSQRNFTAIGYQNALVHASGS